MKKNEKTQNPSIKLGLSKEQIEQRKKDHLVNFDTSIPTKSIKRILYENFFTLFNFLNLILAIAIFSVGSYKNMLFLGIVILNTAISTFQEIHSKRMVDKLAVMASNKATVIRDGKKAEISINEIVLDDLLVLNTGNQLATDAIILDGEIEVNESFITGEPDSILKQKGDLLLSGSFIISGTAKAKVEHIGEENYTSKISRDAKYIKKVNSEIMASLNKIIKLLTFTIIPLGILLFWSQFHIPGNTLQDAVVKAVAAMIGMIPEGLVLLTSTVLAVSVIRLSKTKVLVQELYCIETLARVDTLCLDKTGTLTEGKMEVKKIVPLHSSEKEIENILANLANHSTDHNATIEAIRDGHYPIHVKWNPTKIIPFSSQTKWSGIHFEETGCYLLGAPEMILKGESSAYESELQKYSQDYRVLVLAYSESLFQGRNLPENRKAIAFILISDKIRKEASQTLQYFKEQGVCLKVISGDNPITVSKIAKEVQLAHYDKYIDMSTISLEDDLEKIADTYTIFGRVSPEQKKALILAMQKQGKTVAMTGDGVNDVLALKASDCSIAMANGSDATKSVSQLILLDSNFASMPKVVAEGRRTINNIQRSASLFLVKTIYSSILSLLFLLLGTEYPFEPIQLSLISVVTIGIPSFILALEPNKEKIQGTFLKNVISHALPTALTVILNIFIISVLTKFNVIPNTISSTLCVIATGISGILLLFSLCKSRKSENSKLPFSIFRLALSLIMTLLFILGLTQLGWLFNLTDLKPLILLISEIFIFSTITFLILKFYLKKLSD